MPSNAMHVSLDATIIRVQDRSTFPTTTAFLCVPAKSHRRSRLLTHGTRLVSSECNVRELNRTGGVEIVEKLAELFLTPSSILIGAPGVARTEGLKFGISSIGILSSVLWIRAYEAGG